MTYMPAASERILQMDSSGPLVVATGIPSPSGPRKFGDPWWSKSRAKVQLFAGKSKRR